MTPPYRLADLSAEQMQMIESLENEIGLTLVAYEPEAGTARHSASAAVDADANQRMLDALVDTYRTHQPYI